jgi:anti-sigma regulatory factor (Ser/Thr protein kinase)
MSPSVDSTDVHVSDGTGVGEARRAARGAAEDLGLGEVGAEQAAIVATEASRNVLLHGGGGHVVVTSVHDGGFLDVIALDRGPGIADLPRAMRDGYSTRGTAGHGLGAISRIASVLDVYSLPGKGTALLARIEKKHRPRAAEVGAICVAVATESECGDAWALEAPAGRPVVFLADGLGHGHHAAEAAHAAVAAFRKNVGLPAGRLVEAVHAALRPTRGAAVAVAELADDGGAVRYAGVGNISGVLLGSGMRKMVSLSGTAGHGVRSIRSFDYDWPSEGLLVMHSDGIATHWDLAQYPGLAMRHPALVAGVLYRDFSRARDDATVIVVRRKAA